MMRLLEVVALTKRFAGVAALDAVSFTAEERQILAVLGPNGAGKTTCIDCISGLAAADSGRIIFDGREITGRSPHRLVQDGIARTFQIARPFTALTAAENVAVALGHRRYHGVRAALGAWRDADLRPAAVGALERVGLAAHADCPAGMLPAAMQKRLDLARALALRPRLILLDEPFAGLAREEALALAALIRSLPGDGLTVVLAERNMRSALELADRVVVLGGGALVASGSRERVGRDPRLAEIFPGGDMRIHQHGGPAAGSAAPPGQSRR